MRNGFTPFNPRQPFGQPVAEDTANVPSAEPNSTFLLSRLDNPPHQNLLAKRKSLGQRRKPLGEKQRIGRSNSHRTRKSHLKSRNGCNTCKRRRIKCDETIPQWYERLTTLCRHPLNRRLTDTKARIAQRMKSDAVIWTLVRIQLCDIERILSLVVVLRALVNWRN